MKHMQILLRDTPSREAGWIYGELHIPSIVTGQNRTATVLDFSEFRALRLASAQQHAVALTAVELAHHPLSKLTLPVIALPEITLALSLPEVRLAGPQAAALLNTASHFSLAFAVALALLFAGPIAVLETQSLVSRASRSFNEYTSTPAPESGRPTPTALPSPTPEITSPKDIFSISFPDLGIESTITANVNPADPTQYRAALQEGIAHAAGSGLPDQLDVSQTVYLFAHSTDAQWNIARYNAQFYALKDAEPGQRLTVRFWGQDYQYEVTEKLIIAADDTSWLEPQFDQPRLVLQTCYPPGTAWKRLLVVAVPVPETE